MYQEVLGRNTGVSSERYEEGPRDQATVIPAEDKRSTPPQS